MEVRPVAGLEEFRATMALNVRSWRAAYADVLPQSVLDDLRVPGDDELRERFPDDGDERAFLVALDPEVVGFADVRWDPAETRAFVGPDEAELRAIYVDPERWGEGVGSALLDAALERVPRDRSALVLEVLAGNDRGIGFYEARGFRQVGTDTFEVAGVPYPTEVRARDL